MGFLYLTNMHPGLDEGSDIKQDIENISCKPLMTNEAYSEDPDQHHIL